MKAFTIHRDDDTVGYTTDELLADRIDGMELSPDAADSENQTVTYTVKRGGE